MKLIIQIPCFNEEATLPMTLKEIPREFKGVDTMEILVIDDGSTDNTEEVARKEGVDHIVKHTHNKGLAQSFATGLKESLLRDADIIVNTDGDNQYAGKDIQKLIDPVIAGRADIVIGDRDVMKIEHFSFIKKWLQRLGSWVVRHLSGTSIPDVTSGFRAFSREAALQISILSKFTYTLETVIQAGKKNMSITHIPVRTNEKLRPSRLFQNIPTYLKRSLGTIFKVYTLYQPLRVFSVIGSVVFGIGFLITLRFIYFYITGDSSGHIQSLVLSAVFMIVGFQIFVIGLMAELISTNRKFLEDIIYHIRKINLSMKQKDDKEQK
ncbi:MAG: glycosyltransferase family 2 protein [bacterium]